jgi:hypothetical protein
MTFEEKQQYIILKYLLSEGNKDLTLDDSHRIFHSLLGDTYSSITESMKDKNRFGYIHYDPVRTQKYLGEQR